MIRLLFAVASRRHTWLVCGARDGCKLGLSRRVPGGFPAPEGNVSRFDWGIAGGSFC